MTKEKFFQRTAAFISSVFTLENELSLQSQDPRLTPQQHQLMRILYFSGPQNLSQLSKCMNINLPNCSREVKKLASAGFLKKDNTAEDRRIVHIALSPEGKKAIEAVLQRMMELFLEKKSGRWSAEKAQRWINAMDLLQKELFDS